MEFEIWEESRLSWQYLASNFRCKCNLDHADFVCMLGDVYVGSLLEHMWVSILYGTRETAGAFWAQRQMSLASQSRSRSKSGSRLLGVRPHLHGAMQFWTDRDLIVQGVGVASPCYCGRQQVRLAFWLQHLTSPPPPENRRKLP